ncbi:DUF1428 family protein [Hyphomonas sp.]|uniref:DUF1428 family protein n=1 Tax=Hyphomonas sp. TaxID=87 RepID=UPI0034A04C7D
MNALQTGVLKKPAEEVVFSWINRKDQAAHNAGWQKVMAAPRRGRTARIAPAPTWGG